DRAGTARSNTPCCSWLEDIKYECVDTLRHDAGHTPCIAAKRHTIESICEYRLPLRGGTFPRNLAQQRHSVSETESSPSVPSRPPWPYFNVLAWDFAGTFIRG